MNIMIDYKNCTSVVVLDESWWESALAGIGFIGCLAAAFLLLALISEG
jgi:hypothetical protein